MEEAHQTARGVLNDRREALDRLSNLLLEHETLERDQFEALLAGAPQEDVFARDLLFGRSHVAAFEQVGHAPVPSVQLDLQVTAALAERHELIGGDEAGAQMLGRPVHDMRGGERDRERARIGERTCAETASSARACRRLSAGA